MSLSCVNRGGPASLLRLPQVPVLEREMSLPASAADALRAWNARCGEIFTAVDPQSAACRVRLTCWSDDEIRCVPFEPCRGRVESPVAITVCQALPDKERFELVLQKLTELGVTRIVPMLTERSSTPEERDAGQRKSHRWPDVVLRAARQCRRAGLPELTETAGFAEVLGEVAACEAKFMLYEGEAPWSLAEELGRLRFQSVALLVGPEGGFTPGEVAAAQAHGVLPVSLGPRLLRTETAAIVAATLAQHIVGDLK